MNIKRILAAIALCLALVPGIAQAAPAGDIEAEVDLTRLDGVEAIDALYDMMDAPEANQGRAVRLQGFLNCAKSLKTGEPLFHLLIYDPSSCCAEQIEFIPAVMPEDIQELEFSDDEIIVAGLLDFYDDEGFTEVRVIDAEMIWPEA